jgi:transcription elongation factor Elf1
VSNSAEVKQVLFLGAGLMSLLVTDYNCPHCLNNQTEELVKETTSAFYLLCRICDEPVPVLLVNAALKVVAKTADDEVVEIIGHKRNEKESVLLQIKPLNSATFESGVNPFCLNTELQYRH